MNQVKGETITFDGAVSWVSDHHQHIPMDDLLRLYAFYKVAKGNEAKPNNDKPIVSAFKANALMQVGHLPMEIAEEKYTELVRQLM